MSISTSACLFSMSTTAARYAWQYALGARPGARPLWLKRLSGGEHEKAFDFSDFSWVVSFGLGFFVQPLITAFNYSFESHVDGLLIFRRHTLYLLACISWKA